MSFSSMSRYVFHLQGEHSAISSKPDASAKLLFIGSLVFSSFVVDVAYMQKVQLYLC
jgi:hypothetical protein